MVAQNIISTLPNVQTRPEGVGGLAQTQSEKDIAEALQDRISAIRHAEAKRAFAPNILGAISGVIAGAIGFTRHKHDELLGIIRNLRGDGRINTYAKAAAGSSKYGNEYLRELAVAYNTHEQNYAKMRNEDRKNLGVWLHETYEDLKHRDVISRNELLSHKLEQYQKDSAQAWDLAQQKVKLLTVKLAQPGIDPAKQEHLNWKIEQAYEKAYVKITSARQQFRTVIDEEVLMTIRRLGKHIGFRDLTRQGQTRAVAMGITVAAAVGFMVRAFLQAVTSESSQERAERQELQATKLWELSRKPTVGTDVAMMQELNTQLSSGRLQDLVQQSAPQGYVDRLAREADAPAVQTQR